ncbi:MAG: hypothetical protein E6Q78_15770 [Rhodoferax sp.]|nr:MAG: hypothetical protein E6Q78_15770 [Rhodoferax sp.]
MFKDRFLNRLGLAFIALFAAFYFWQNPGLFTGKLTQAEIDTAIAKAGQQVPFPPGRKEPILKAVRAWAEADDGKPFYMLNLMRFYKEVKKIPGAPNFEGSPAQANALYEAKATMMLVPAAGSAPIMANVQGKNVINSDSDAPTLDDWSRVLVVRYPNRRAFLQLISDPSYAPIEPYKAMALEFLLVPIEGNPVIPDPHVIVGALLLVIFLGVGWKRAARADR